MVERDLHTKSCVGRGELEANWPSTNHRQPLWLKLLVEYLRTGIDMGRFLKAGNRWHHRHCTGINEQPFCPQLNAFLARLDAHCVRVNKRRNAINNHHAWVIREHVVVLAIELRHDCCFARKRFVDRPASRCRTHERLGWDARNINTRPTIHLR